MRNVLLRQKRGHRAVPHRVGLLDRSTIRPASEQGLAAPHTHTRVRLHTTQLLPLLVSYWSCRYWSNTRGWPATGPMVLRSRRLTALAARQNAPSAWPCPPPGAYIRPCTSRAALSLPCRSSTSASYTAVRRDSRRALTHTPAAAHRHSHVSAQRMTSMSCTCACGARVGWSGGVRAGRSVTSSSSKSVGSGSGAAA
jgi:hypothetical protein